MTVLDVDIEVGVSVDVARFSHGLEPEPEPQLVPEPDDQLVTPKSSQSDLLKHATLETCSDQKVRTIQVSGIIILQPALEHSSASSLYSEHFVRAF